MNLTRAMAIYFHKFQPQTNSYESYLEYYANTIQPLSAQVKNKYIEAAISAQFWLNAVED